MFAGRLSTLVTCALLIALLTVPAGAETVKRAVLIGIDDYRANDDDLVPPVQNAPSDLRGCGNDVDLMKSVLIGRFDFEPENVLVLKDSQATRAGIINGIRSHLGQSRPGDIALVHYSGHGSRMEDVSGDEVDGMDETLVPHDSRQGGVFDISDDQINGLMKEISDKTPHVVFILDSCHSGTASRAVAAGNTARQAPDDDREPPAPEPWALGARGHEEAADGIRLPGANYVLISGCRANELSNEGVFNGARHGAMTYFLARALQAAQANTTYKDVMEQVKADVNARFALQHPQFEGTGTDTRVFGVERVQAQPYVLVEPAGSGATVQAGRVFGVEVGAELDVFPAGTKVFDGSGKPKSGTIRVTAVEDFTSDATIVEGSVAPHSRAVLDRVAPPDVRAGLLLEDRQSSDLLEGVAVSLANDKTIEIVTDPALADMRASVEGEGAQRRIVLRGRELQELSVATSSAAPETVTDCAGNEVPSPFQPSPQAPPAQIIQEKAVAQIKHWARWFGLLAIDNPSGGTMPMDFRIERVGAAPGDAAPESIAPGDRVRVLIKNASKTERVHLTLLDFRRDGAVCVLAPGATPSTLEPEEVWQGGVEFEAMIPAGVDEEVDILKAIFTTDPIPGHVLALGAAPRALFTPVATSGWTTQKRVLRIARPGVENHGFIAHYETAEAASRAPESLSRSDTGSRSDGPFADDPTMVTISTTATRGDDTSIGSVGQAFEEAYEYRRQACAQAPDACPTRVEPLLELELSRSQSAPLLEEGTRGIDPLTLADKDPIWSHRYTRVPEAWQHLESLGKPRGAVADGVKIAHPDTGYLPHPEIWEPAADRPILADRGWDYLEGDADPLDRTEKERLLDNPVHGTGSSSAIISRSGCQIDRQDEKCPTGVAQGARLVPLRVNSSVVNFSGDRLALALLDASLDGSDVVRPRMKEDTDLASIAMGGPPSWVLWKVVKVAEERGFIVIAAAGNYVRTVTWPARYDSVIAVAAVNANCEPWVHSSRGRAVDIAAPGESVWRATIDEKETRITGMGTGTTYATATTTGIAALWVAKHKGTPAYELLKEQGLLTRALRWLMQETSWQPGGDRVPENVQCKDGVGWNETKFGAGILDARALLERELPSPAELEAALAVAGTRGGTPGDGEARTAETLEELPLWGSLYPDGTPQETAASDYRRLFSVDEKSQEIALYEVEVLHHYAASESVAEAIDTIVLLGRRDDGAFALARRRLRARDLSKSLRSVLR